MLAPLHAAATPRAARRIVYETLAVFIASLLVVLFLPRLKELAAFVPIAYLLADKFVRRRPWAAYGWKPREAGRAIAANWRLIFLVAVVSQGVQLFAGRAWIPGWSEHVLGRLPDTGAGGLLTLALLLPLTTLGEEIVYRGLLQERLTWVWPAVAAVLFAAALFGLMHYAPGPRAVVIGDVVGVAVDGALYGWIFLRGRNLFPAWLAHLLADVVGLALLAWFV